MRLGISVTRVIPAWSAAVTLVAACATVTPSATPASSPTPTPCIDPFACAATPGPIRTLPPIPTTPPDPDATPTLDPSTSFRVATASCLLYAPGGTAIGDIDAQDPDLVLWLGDNIYADTTDMTQMRRIYDSLGANPRFEALRTSTELMAVWDDHDYGWNNANATWPYKDGAKAEFLRFWRAAEDDPRWGQPGVYSSKTFGSGDRTVQVILLDNRYNLDPWDYAGTNSSAQVLGEVQWAWLEAQLQVPATIRIIGSGVQVVQDYDIDNEWEGWGDSPLQRERLFRTIREAGVGGVVFVSGDMHFAELSRHPNDAEALGYPTWDLTASGLDRVETEGVGLWDNPNRVGELLNTNSKFGMVEIDWSKTDPEIHLEIWDRGDLFLKQVIRLSELQPAGSPS